MAKTEISELVIHFKTAAELSGCAAWKDEKYDKRGDSERLEIRENMSSGLMDREESVQN